MRVYFSGIGGVGLGPLAEIAVDGGYDILGSDPIESPLFKQLQDRGAKLSTNQDGVFLSDQHETTPIDWFVHTSALPANHPELLKAHELGIKTSKRDVFLSEFIQNKKLRLIAVAGTHGKTTTTGMLVWLFKHFNIPVSYSVGSTLSFGPSGAYDPASEFFVYECDEYDRNFLQFEPEISLIPAYDYDHPDIYPTEEDYAHAFLQFFAQSSHVLLWSQDAFRISGDVLDAVNRQTDDSRLDEIIELTEETVPLNTINLSGAHSRRNAWLAAETFSRFVQGEPDARAVEEIAKTLTDFPGTGRRFEKLAENLFSDYGHHPTEIAATLQMALEVNPRVVIVYQPHQNSRQHEIKDDYKHAFDGAEKVYWLPTYLSRENPDLHVYSPEELIQTLEDRGLAESGELNDQLWQTIQAHLATESLVLCMGAGTIDSWVRAQLND